MKESEEIDDLSFFDDEKQEKTETERYFEVLAAKTLYENRNEFEDFLKFYDWPLLQYPKTLEYLERHVNDFTKRFNRAIDKELLIKSELKRFDKYGNIETLHNDFIARGFYWAIMGKELKVKDFFCFIPETMAGYGFYIHKPANDIKNEWLELKVIQNLDNAVLGYSYALYMQYLKETDLTKQENQIEVDAVDSESETKGKIKPLSAWAKILLLNKLGFFNLETIENCMPETIAPIVSAIIGSGKDLHNIKNYIRQREGLEKDNSTGKPKDELERINKMLAQIGLKPGK